MNERNPHAVRRRICGAKNRQGEPRGRAPRPNGRCHLHGGKSLGGIASPRFKHGHYSRFIYLRLAAELWGTRRED